MLNVIKCCFLLHSYCKQESSYYIQAMKPRGSKKINPPKNSLKVGEMDFSNIVSPQAFKGHSLNTSLWLSPVSEVSISCGIPH